MHRDRALQLHAALRDREPPVWRRLVAPAWLSLDDLHAALQCAFGWEARHRYVFGLGERRFAVPEEGEARPERLGDAEFTLLAALELAPGSRLAYVYDFAEAWRHELEVEAVLGPEAAPRLPACVAGEGLPPAEEVRGNTPGGAAAPFAPERASACLREAFGP